MTETLLNIVQYTIPSLIVFLTAYFFFRSQTNKEMGLKQYELRKESQKTTLPLRLQAYERLSIFLERTHFNNLIPRVRDSSMSAKELQYEIISNIKMEYEHNISQQIYVSSELWRLIHICRDELIKTANLVGASLNKDASGTDFSKALFQYIIESDTDLPNEKVLDYLKNEVRSLY